MQEARQVKAGLLGLAIRMCGGGLGPWELQGRKGPPNSHQLTFELKNRRRMLQ